MGQAIKIEREGKNIYLHIDGIVLRIDRIEFIADVLNYLNGGDSNGRRYILETTLIGDNK